MISKDLMNLIHAYNEHGIYFLFNSILWWFNGKRIEKWCYCPNILKIFVYDSNLYARNEWCFRNVLVLENQRFQYFGTLDGIFDIEGETINPWTICLDDDNNLYNYSSPGTFQKNGHPLPKRKYRFFGMKLLYYDGFLYFFSFDCNGINEKFDIKTNKWSFFSHQLICNNWIVDIYSFNNIFYTLFENGKIGTYNPKTDTWQLSPMKL